MSAGPALFPGTHVLRPTPHAPSYIGPVILREERRNIEHTVPDTGVRLGRDPSLDIVFPEEDNVVSAHHCRIYRDDAGAWWLEDLRSTNGTFLNGHRIEAPERLNTGARISLGQRGPTLRVTVPGQVLATLAEPAIDMSQPVVRLRRVKGGEDLTATGREVVMGRAAACHIPLRTVVDTVVSKRHAMIEFESPAAIFLSDLGSRNGTYLNARQISGRTPLRVGDRIMLGWQGPLFEVRILGAAAMDEGAGAPYEPRREPPRTLAGIVAVAEEEARASGGKRAPRFMKSLLRQLATESSFAFRALTALVLLLLAAGVIWVYQVGARRTAEAEARLATTQRQLTEELRHSAEAQKRQSEELDLLRSQLASARASAVSRSVLDSLERRVRDAEARAAAPPPAGATAPPSPAASADFTQVARDNGRTVGLVIVRYLSDSVMGSGFAITPSGYFVTNRHVVQSDSRGAPRSIAVVMAETNVALIADLVSVSSVEEQDVAILKVRGFRGSSVRQVDWRGFGAQQGAPAAMLGFPFGTQLALDAGTVRAHLFGGYIAQTGDWLRFSGVTYAGVSGSPVFNQAGEVIAVHFGAAQAGPGLAVSLPMRLVRRWLPAEARAELGLN